MGYAELLINIALCMVKCFHYECKQNSGSRAELSMGGVKGKAYVLAPAPCPQPACPPPGLSNPTFIFTTICQVRTSSSHFTDSSLRPRGLAEPVMSWSSALSQSGPYRQPPLPGSCLTRVTITGCGAFPQGSLVCSPYWPQAQRTDSPESMTQT